MERDATLTGLKADSSELPSYPQSRVICNSTMRQNVAEVYEWIVDDVFEKCQDVFAQEGIDSSVLRELREMWSRRLKESGAMGSNGSNDEYEWAAEKSERAAVAVKPPKPQLTTIHTTHRRNSQTQSPSVMRGVALGVPQKGVQPSYTSRGYLPGDVSIWPPHHNHAIYPYTGQSAVYPTMSRQQPTHMISPSQGPRPARSATGVMDSSLLLNSLCSGAPTRANAIRVVANDNAFRLHPYTSLTTSPAPQVRLSGKRKGPDDATSLMSHTASTKAVRRKSGDNKTTSVIPQRDGADEKPPTPIPTTDTQEPDLESDSTLPSGDDEEEPIESSNCLTAQYDKVNRIKNRWRCQLKHGIFHIDGRDYLFKSATGEFTF